MAEDCPFADAEGPLHSGTAEVEWSMDDRWVTVTPHYTCDCNRFTTDEFELIQEVFEELKDLLADDKPIEGISGLPAGYSLMDIRGFYGSEPDEDPMLRLKLRYSPHSETTAAEIGSRLAGLVEFDGLEFICRESYGSPDVPQGNY